MGFGPTQRGPTLAIVRRDLINTYVIFLIFFNLPMNFGVSRILVFNESMEYLGYFFVESRHELSVKYMS